VDVIGSTAAGDALTQLMPSSLIDASAGKIGAETQLLKLAFWGLKSGLFGVKKWLFGLLRRRVINFL
jgi:hypothetical protein